MIIFPAIDLKDGQCVRLQRGLMHRATVFNNDPAAQASLFEAQGFEWLHVVDLNGAFAGRSANTKAVEAIRAATKFPIQLGGGIRSMAAIETWLAAGIARVILGTAALKSPALVREAAKKFPGQVAVGIDAEDGMVAVEGWSEISDIKAAVLARKFEDAGVAAIIFTDIARDGMLQGVNVSATSDLANSVRIPVIASGGVSGSEDIFALREAGNIAGVVVGRALYDGRLTAENAMEAAS